MLSGPKRGAEGRSNCTLKIEHARQRGWRGTGWGMGHQDAQKVVREGASPQKKTLAVLLLLLLNGGNLDLSDLLSRSTAILIVAVVVAAAALLVVVVVAAIRLFVPRDIVLVEHLGIPWRVVRQKRDQQG